MSRPITPEADGAGAALPAHPDAALLATLTQGSTPRIAARVGRVTASRLADVVGRTRTGYGAARAAYMSELLAERLSGRPAEPYVTPAMAWGRRHEPGARAAYEFFRGVDVAPCGLLLHPTIGMAGASPDGLVGGDGLLEVKCPTTAAHLDVVMKGDIPERHQIQMQWQMACSGRRWGDFVSFDPRLPEPARLVILRLARDDARIAVLEGEVRLFLEELAARLSYLRAGSALPEIPGGPEPGHPGQPGAAAASAGVDGHAAGRDPAARAAAPSAPPPAGAAPRTPRPEGSGVAPPASPDAAPPQRRPRAIVDVGSSRRQPLTPRRRLALYEAHGGICCICGNRIVGSRWVDEHIRPLSLGGSNDLANRAPAHERCAQEKTRDDLRRLAKAKAQKRAHLGLKAATRLIASRPFPRSERVRPDLSPLGPPRAARYADGVGPERAGDGQAAEPDEG